MTAGIALDGDNTVVFSQVDLAEQDEGRPGTLTSPDRPSNPRSKSEADAIMLDPFPPLVSGSR